jgi:hypothetical protein
LSRDFMQKCDLEMLIAPQEHVIRV